MKKYCFLILTAAIAASFTACGRSRTREVLFVDNPPNLTTMTMTTVVPSDTYSEYMATYTPEETFETGYSRYSYTRPEGFSADTAFRENRDTAAVYRDTAATHAVTTVPEESTLWANTEVPSSFSETVTETAAVTEDRFTHMTYTAASADRPQRDTMMSGGFTRDTMHSAQRTEESTESAEVTENTAGGAENAN